MPGRKPRSSIGKKFDRCVRDVRAKGGAYDPEAVCAAQMRRTYGSERFQELSRRGRRGTRSNPHRIRPGDVVVVVDREGYEALCVVRPKRR